MSDLIDRQAAIDIANDLRDCISVEGYWAWTERLTRLPSVQPQHKTGKWIDIEPYMVICPFCKHASSRKNFCAECGADMRDNSDE